jgi:hypothetical protein
MRSILIITVLLVCAIASFAQRESNPESWCRGGFFTREHSDFNNGTEAGTKAASSYLYSDFKIGTAAGTKTTKIYFHNDEPAGCPAGEDCRGKAYIVGGDKVLVSKSIKGFSCAWYVAPNGKNTVGWLPSASIRLTDPDKNPPLAKWHGEWKHADGQITFTDNKLAGFLNVTGDAVWKGLGDNIHVGEIDGRFAPEGNVLEYSDGEDEFDCKATMRLIGDYLVVADNLKCGGANVTFSGVYRRAGKARPAR